MLKAAIRLLKPEMLRFAVVLVAGLAVDLAVGFTLATLVGLPLALAAAVGFGAGALFNYVLHEFWTFGGADDGLSPVRAGLYVMSSLVSLGVRVAVVAALSPLAVDAAARLGVLVVAVGCSFVANYLLSRFVVYRRGR